MRTFSIAGAAYYCSSFSPSPGIAERSLEEFRHAKLAQGSKIVEGTSLFDEYRACALRETERSLYLSASHYRRAIDLLIPSSGHWAHVTLYYGAWYAARALLGLFGCSVLHNYIVHVDQSSAGNQHLYVQRIGNRQNQYSVKTTGSHQRFWEIFYRAAPKIRRFVSASVSPALSPVSNRETWLIDQRNQVNYNTVEGISVGKALTATSILNNFPDHLPGALNTQYSICEGLLTATCGFADQFGLSTDVFYGSPGFRSFQRHVRDSIYAPTIPDLVDKTRKEALFGR